MQYARKTEKQFPSRHYAYGKTMAFPALSLESGKVYRFILGRDAGPVPLSSEEGRRVLADPFAQLVLFGGETQPQTLRALLAQLNRLNADQSHGLAEQSSFVVADGGQIPWTEATEDLQRAFRFVVTRKRLGDVQPDLLISTSTAIDSESAFLQVIGWDPVAGAYQFYDRRNGAWIWAGSSWDALEPGSRGLGPFDSHVNGALNMKELKQPWVNWNSMAARILDTALAPIDPLRQEPLWNSRRGGEEFETEVARPGIRRWNDSRFQRLSQANRLRQLPAFMRQVLETSTINLTSSTVSSGRLGTVSSVPLPISFFINSDALIDVIGLNPEFDIPETFGAVYRSTLEKFDVAITDGKHRFPGDTNFVFVVPEPAFEDNLILDSLLRLGVLSRHLAASLLMVDFQNPIFSQHRTALLKYVPEDAALGDPKDFESVYIGKVRQAMAAGTAGEPERALLDNIELGENQWEREFERRITNFFQALEPRLKDADQFASIFQLAESRRREFRKRPLAEFRLTLPVTNIAEDAPLLEFTEAGEIHPKT